MGLLLQHLDDDTPSRHHHHLKGSETSMEHRKPRDKERRGRQPRLKVSSADRKRVAKACLLCKKRKRKCDYTHDAGCTPCRLNGRECILGTQERPKSTRRRGTDLMSVDCRYEAVSLS